MSSPSRKLRRAQERRMIKGMRQAVRERAGTPPQPTPAERSADRMQHMGVLHARSLLWTPPGVRQ